MWGKFYNKTIDFYVKQVETSIARYKLYEVIPNTKVDQNHLRSLSLSTEAYDFWTMPKELGRKSDIMVAPDFQDNLENFLQKLNISYTVAVENVETIVQKERFLQAMSRAFSRPYKFNRYYRYNEIVDYIDNLAKKYPELVTVTTIGKSYEKKDIKMIFISDKNSSEIKNTILIDAGIHAREWIAPATAMYVIHELIEKYSENKNLLKNLDWIIVPVSNVDGYEYSHTKVKPFFDIKKKSRFTFYCTVATKLKL